MSAFVQMATWLRRRLNPEHWGTVRTATLEGNAGHRNYAWSQSREADLGEVERYSHERVSGVKNGQDARARSASSG